jgi:hypothetical protein
MNLQLARITTTSDALLGTLSVNNQTECYTLENRDLCIPVGTYEIGIYDSPHAGHLVPILKNVPGREWVEIHSGNVSSDSKGCILVGTSCTTDSVLDSRFAFAHLFPQIESAIQSGEQVTLSLT